LLYHRVGIRDGSYLDAYTVSPATFERQMRWLDRNGWHATTLESLVDPMTKGHVPRRFVLTFDDGFASNREHAWPILDDLGFPSETFLVTDHVGDFNRWDGPTNGTYPLLDRLDIAAANTALMSFHAHSASHAALTSLTRDRDAMRRELRESRSRLADLGCTGKFFAYPFGSWNWRVMEEVRAAGYLGACTCMEGLNSRWTNPFLLRRIEVREADVGARFQLKLTSGRDLLQFPPSTPPEISLLAAWLRRYWKVRT
jgi:peptidoglycan/xylan/chitin deacetylase (PgdA/CDA1 family)